MTSCKTTQMTLKLTMSLLKLIYLYLQTHCLRTASESFSFIGKHSANCATREQGMTIDVEEGKGVASLKIDTGSVTHFHSSLSIFNDLTTLPTTLLFSLYICFFSS